MTERFRFGTDGWRGIIARDFTFATVAEVTNAIVTWLQEQELAGRGLIIGRDRRFLSSEFAGEAARIAAARGLNVDLVEDFLPSPGLSWAVRSRQAGAGIMITASHNPPEYSGIKLKENFGGSARPETTARIETLCRQGIRPSPPGPGAVRRIEVREDYLSQLERCIDMAAIARSAPVIAIDAMHGAGAGFLGALLQRNGVPVLELRAEANPGFGGQAPNPVAANLSALSAAIRSGRARVGFATDGDADRLGAIDEAGTFCGPQIIFPLLLEHLLRYGDRRGRVVKSASTTRLVDRICARFGLPLSQTPIGFKYACQEMLKGDVLIAGEESGAPGIPDHLPDRDGLLAALLLLEAMAVRQLSLAGLAAELTRDYGPNCYRQSDFSLPEETLPEIAATVRELAPSTLAGRPVVGCDRLDGLKLTRDDGAWLLLRVSGTEPLLRLYAEADDAAGVAELLAAGRRLAGI